MSEMLLAKRATRGLRMTSLIGDAAEQDETFWGDGIWGESDDESFSEVEVEPDQFDSDFNDTEDEGGNSEDEEKAVQKTGETERISAGGTNKYKEPIVLKRKSQANERGRNNPRKHPTDGAGEEQRTTKSASISRNVKIKRDSSFDSSISINPVRAIRQSTKEKTVDSDVARQKASKVKVKSRPPLRHQFSQKELLLDALETETENQKWLEAQRLADYERAVGEKHLKVQSTESYIRTISRRGTYNTVTFSDTDSMPAVLLDSNEKKVPESKICVITGLVALYKDPLTKQPYANIEAFKEIRRQFADFNRNNMNRAKLQSVQIQTKKR